MKINRHDVWGHFAPMFHLVDVFAVYAITLVGGRHVIIPSFTAQEALLTIGARGPNCHTCMLVPIFPLHQNVRMPACKPAERERVSVTNIASTMLTMLVNNPLVGQLDLSSMRAMSCGGSPQSPAVLARAIAVRYRVQLCRR